MRDNAIAFILFCLIGLSLLGAIGSAPTSLSRHGGLQARRVAANFVTCRSCCDPEQVSETDSSQRGRRVLH